MTKQFVPSEEAEAIFEELQKSVARLEASANAPRQGLNGFVLLIVLGLGGFGLMAAATMYSHYYPLWTLFR